MATIAMASVVFRSVFALRNHGTSTPACLPSFSDSGSSFHSLTLTLAPHRPWRQIAEGSLAFENLHLFMREAVVVLDRIVMVVVAVVVCDLFVSLNPAYRAESREVCRSSWR